MALTLNEAYAAKQPFVDKETLEHIVEQFPTPFHLFALSEVKFFLFYSMAPPLSRGARRLCMEPRL